MSPVNALTTKRLDPENINLMEQLLAVFGEAFDEIDTYCGNPPTTEYMIDLLCNENFVALAAIKDDSVVGGLAAYVLPKFEQQRSEMYIYDLAVSEQHRRQGIATSLIENLREIAQNLGVYVIFVQADQGDDAAIELYSGIGTREDVLHFDISPVSSDQ